MKATAPHRSLRLLRRTRAFVLMEAMLAVAIFALGVMALGQCVENCVVALQINEDESRARRILQNRMVELQHGAVPMTKDSVEELDGMFAGMVLKTRREPLKKKNENDQEITGIFAVTLQVSWKADGQERVRDLAFYVYPRQR
jgi:hypothetical protein